MALFHSPDLPSSFKMQRASVGLRLPLLLLFLFLLLPFQPLGSAELDGADEVAVEVVVDSSPCSTTCGLGIKTQTLCLMNDGKTAMEEDAGRRVGTEVSEVCRVRKVKCQESWQCGLRTMTVTAGQRVEIDCLGEVLQAMGRFSWRVLWRYARGIITSDSSLFARWQAPQLDHVILDPVREEDAGEHTCASAQTEPRLSPAHQRTYLCDVQDAGFRRVKRVYWGIRVLPAGILNLDYESAVAQWETAGDQQNRTASDQHDLKMILLYTVLIPLGLAGAAAALIYWASAWHWGGDG
ncbi:transmembrane protein 81 isoform X3 [Scophthalmus maximus]|uniref:transmembrane protein 81 isoform X3 n=1 Tax=Scophthalmus maximus TaxID=52904 RepID=UPI001FA87FC8|nr:transmembrane protein 81 isoform X3 [Scophthalmus maximus]